MPDGDTGEEWNRGQDPWPRRLPRHYRRIRPGRPPPDGEPPGSRPDEGGRDDDPR